GAEGELRARRHAGRASRASRGEARPRRQAGRRRRGTPRRARRKTACPCDDDLPDLRPSSPERGKGRLDLRGLPSLLLVSLLTGLPDRLAAERARLEEIDPVVESR